MNTIVAQSTPMIASAIAVIRLSGDSAYSLARRVFSGFRDASKPRTAYYGTLDAGSVKDDCIAVYFKGPHSYTGEDVVEIYCHGSVAVSSAIIEKFIAMGARMAERGEFTRRAFENGKMDLTESEAVIDLINAQSEAEARSAYGQLGGALSRTITALQQEVTTLIAKLEAAIDYPEEDVEELTAGAIKQEVGALHRALDNLKSTYRAGKIMRDGVRVVIVGKPNAGKSMLMNRLLGYERSIVTENAGTTRDYVEESFLIKDMRFCLIDTAGVRDADDKAEKIGVERSLDMMKSADIVLSLAEAGGEYALPADERFILLENKIDILAAQNAHSIKISALTGAGIDSLTEALYIKAKSLTAACSGGINNLRHLQAVEEAIAGVTRAEEAIEKMLPPDLISDDLMSVYRALGSVTGITTSDKIVGEIFSRFCVGK